MDNRLFAPAICFLLMLFCLAGCNNAKNGRADTGENSLLGAGAGRELSLAVKTEESGAVSEDSPPPAESAPHEADSPMYRGVVTELEEKEGSLFIRLENAEGTDFGYGKILMQTDGDTKTNFREGELKAGDHLEAWFSDRNDGLPPIILTATKLPAVEATVFNGETVRFETRENGEKELELRGLKGEGDIIFRISDETRLYIGESELTPGAWVNVYHQGDLTGSAPPQGRALEIRPYKAKS